jgi:hypothetical protein
MGSHLPRSAALPARLETPVEEWPYLDKATRGLAGLWAAVGTFLAACLTTGPPPVVPPKQRRTPSCSMVMAVMGITHVGMGMP